MIPWVFWKSVKTKKEYFSEKVLDYLNEELAMPPERADLVLPSHVPDSERNVLVFDRLDVKTLLERTRFIFVKSQDTNPNVPIVGIVVTISPSLSL
jgi:hypothetical protein